MIRRKARYISVPELLPRLLDSYDRFAERMAGKSRRYQLRAVRALVRSVEKRDECKISKVSGRVMYVNIDAIESIAPDDMGTLLTVERNLAELDSKHKHLQKQVNSYGSLLRDHTQQIAKLREKQKETASYLAKINAIDQGQSGH